MQSMRYGKATQLSGGMVSSLKQRGAATPEPGNPVPPLPGLIEPGAADENRDLIGSGRRSTERGWHRLLTRLGHLRARVSSPSRFRGPQTATQKHWSFWRITGFERRQS